MATAKLLPVQFHSDTIFCVNVNDQPFAPVKPIVENMGLAWQAQAAKLRANEARWGITIIMIPSESGEQRTLCMPVRKLPAFFASINPNKVRPELRNKIELYQNECDNALWAYWTEGQAVRPAAHGDALSPAEQAHLHAIVKAKVGMMPKDLRRTGFSEVWARFNAHFQIARYAQLAPAKMGEAVEYLVGMEVKAQKALPTHAEQAAASALGVYAAQQAATSAIPVQFREDWPKDMSSGRKDAMKKLERITWQLHAVLDVTRIFSHPGGYTSRRSAAEIERYDILMNLYRTAEANIAAAYNALEAGYRLGREVGRG